MGLSRRRRKCFLLRRPRPAVFPRARAHRVRRKLSRLSLARSSAAVRRSQNFSADSCRNVGRSRSFFCSSRCRSASLFGTSFVQYVKWASKGFADPAAYILFFAGSADRRRHGMTAVRKFCRHFSARFCWRSNLHEADRGARRRGPAWRRRARRALSTAMAAARRIVRRLPAGVLDGAAQLDLRPRVRAVQRQCRRRQSAGDAAIGLSRGCARIAAPDFSGASARATPNGELAERSGGDPTGPFRSMPPASPFSSMSSARPPLSIPGCA